MRRRDLLRTGAGLAVLAAAGCAAPSHSPRSTSAATSGGSSPPADSGAGSSGVSVGGAVDQATYPREVALTTTPGRLLPAAAALYRAALSGTGNAALSPYSIITTLGMLAFGARGDTAAALAEVLGGPADKVASWLTGADSALAKAVAVSKQSGPNSSFQPAEITPANAVFLDDGASVRPEFLSMLARRYGAGVRRVDFAASEDALATINGWVADRTHELIPHLLAVGAVDASTLLVLVNALYFEASWTVPFAVGKTQTFTTANGGTVYVPLMTCEVAMNYATGQNWEAVSIPMVWNLAMTVIVPARGHFAEVAGALDAGLLAAAMSGTEHEVHLALPAFTTDTSLDLRPGLTALGLAELFDAPDLSGIGPGPFLVSRAAHQSRVVVDRNGVVAAAASAVAIADSLPPRAAVVADRPFLWVIHDVATQTPLFLGRITDPTR